MTPSDLQQRAWCPQQLWSCPQTLCTPGAGLPRCRPRCGHSPAWCRCSGRSCSTWRSGSSQDALWEALHECCGGLAPATSDITNSTVTLAFEQQPLTHIFIHIEGFHILEGQLAIVVELNQLLVTAEGGASWKRKRCLQGKSGRVPLCSCFCALKMPVQIYIHYNSNKDRKLVKLFTRTLFQTQFCWCLDLHLILICAIQNQIHVRCFRGLPVGRPRVKYLSGPGSKRKILFLMYLAAHSLALS